MFFYCNSCSIDYFCKFLVIIKVVKEFYIKYIDIILFLNWFVIVIVFFLFVKKYKILVGVLL